MKQNKLKFLMSLVMLLSLLSASAYDFMVDGIAYNMNGSNATVTYTNDSNYYSNNYSGLTVANIPESVTYNGVTYTVTAIGAYAFRRCSSLTSVNIPNSVTSIGERAFYNCALTELNIPNSVTYIGSYAFAECGSLTSVTIPNSVTSIYDRTFENCRSLTRIEIPNSVTSIIRTAFFGCRGLTSMVVKEGNEVYDSRNNCNAIIETSTNTLIAGCQNTTIPNSVTSIGDYAFFRALGPANVIIPNSVTYIGSYAFAECGGLTSVTIPNSVTVIRDWTFDACGSLTSVNIPNSVTSIGEGAFYNCALTELNIPNSVTAIGKSAFHGCAELTSVNIPNSVTSIEGSAFAFCIGLTSVTIGNSVTSIGVAAFLQCTNLTSVTIGNSVTSIGDNAFRLCRKLWYIQFNAVNCTTIYSGTFYGCPSLARLQFGDSVQYIPTGLQSLSMSGKKLVLPNSVKNIKTGALKGTCDAVVIGDNIESISEGAFSDGIRVAYVSSTTPRPCSAGAFVNPQTLYVPQGCRGKYLMSDGWSEFVNIVEGSYVCVTDLTLDMDSATIHETDTLQFNATVLPSNHSATMLGWLSTNTAVAYVSSTGLVTAVAEGEADICCWVDNKSVVCHITVVENHIADSIQLNYSDLLLDWDNIVDLTATVLPENASQEVTWTIPENDNIYARVVGNKLRVMAMRSGSVTVTATSVADPSVSADCVITIQIPDVNGDTNLNISDVTALIDYLLGGNPESINIGDADVNRDGNINIADVTTLIDKLLSGN